MELRRTVKEFTQAPSITLLTDRLSIPQATVGSEAARVPASSLLQVMGAEEYLMLEVLELLVVVDRVEESMVLAGRVEDSMAEGVDNSNSVADK